jgi:hypothetical protein
MRRLIDQIQIKDTGVARLGRYLAQGAAEENDAMAEATLAMA